MKDVCLSNAVYVCLMYLYSAHISYCQTSACEIQLRKGSEPNILPVVIFNHINLNCDEPRGGVVVSWLAWWSSELEVGGSSLVSAIVLFP